MKAVAHPAFAVAYPQRCDLVRKRSERVLGIAPESRTNRREPNWGEFADQVIPELPLSQTSDGNYVASELVPCVFLAAPHPLRHITPSATEGRAFLARRRGDSRREQRGNVIEPRR